MWVLRFCVLLMCIYLALSQGIFPGKDDSCFDHPQQGNCKAHIPNFYFKVEAGYCDCFVYSGCGGNANRFTSLKDCMNTCGVRRDQQIITTNCRNKFKGTRQLREILQEFGIQPTSLFEGRQETQKRETQLDVARSCFDAPVTGRCKAFVPSFYYNVNAGYCDCFVYTGCGGNANRFDSHVECMNTCGVRRTDQIVSESCRKHFRGTKQLDEMLSSFRSESIEPETAEVAVNTDKNSRPVTPNPENKHNCLANFKAGDCKAFIPSFYYNAQTGYCDCSVYTGCGGNSNRFESLRQCMNSCDVRSTDQILSESCLKHFRGTKLLRELLTEFRSDITKTETSQFDKQKPSRAETSISESANKCSSPLQAGNCKAFIPSFYYNANAGYCDCFVFTGCGGNSNRFDTLEECMNSCGVSRDKQIISTECRDTLKGTKQLDRILTIFGRDNSGNNPKPDDSRLPSRRPPSPSDIKKGILVAVTSLPPPPPPPLPTKSSSSVPSFFQSAKHPWQ